MRRPAALASSIAMKRPAARVASLSMIQLVEHEAIIRPLLEAEPTMGKRTLARKLLSEHGLRVSIKTAENDLARLRGETGSRAIRNVCGSHSPDYDYPMLDADAFSGY